MRKESERSREEEDVERKTGEFIPYATRVRR